MGDINERRSQFDALFAAHHGDVLRYVARRAPGGALNVSC